MKEFKVLFSLARNPLIGGGWTATHEIYSALQEEIQIKPFFLGAHSTKETITKKIFFRIFDIIVLFFRLLHERPDLIHHNTAMDRKTIVRDFPVVFLSKLMGIKLVFTIHGSFEESFRPYKLKLLNMMRQYILKNVGLVLVFSDTEKKQFTSAYPYLCEKIVITKNVLNEEFFKAARKESPTPKIILISRLEEMKGIPEFLEAIQNTSILPEPDYYIIGDGPMVPFIRQFINAGQYNGKLHYLGQLPNYELIPHLQSAHALVFPSKYPEGMPMVLLEALASGTPIITSQNRFAREVLTDNENCLYLNSVEAAEIGRRILQIINDRSLREKLTVKSRELAENYRKVHLLPRLIKLYTQLLDN